MNFFFFIIKWIVKELPRIAVGFDRSEITIKFSFLLTRGNIIIVVIIRVVVISWWFRAHYDLSARASFIGRSGSTWQGSVDYFQAVQEVLIIESPARQRTELRRVWLFAFFMSSSPLRSVSPKIRNTRNCLEPRRFTAFIRVRRIFGARS